MSKTLYEILGVEPSASLAEVQKAFNKIRWRLRRAGDQRAMEELQIAQEAFAILSNPDKRAAYDQKLARKATAQEGLGGNGKNGFSARLGALPNFLGDPPPALPPPEHPFPPFPSWPRQRLPDFSFVRNPLFLVFLAALLALMYWRMEANKIEMLEAKLLTNEKAVAEALKEKNEVLRRQQQIQQEAEQARQEDERERAARQAETEQKRLELENRRIDLEQSAVEARHEAELKRIDASVEIAKGNQEIRRRAEVQKAQAEAELARSQSRSLDMDTKQKQFDYSRTVQEESIAVQTEWALREKYRQQELDGEDHISHSNPGLGLSR